ncbi:hypothetical protein [Kribbella sp. CA-294648]|uniref:hypothetical protein n=1 Tax=Kribbella sp. CA-294648 TaxID=3239948 RepID=UPI003D8F537D
MNGYSPRTVTQYGVETINGWPTKLYGLAVEGEPGQELVAAARSAAGASLPTTTGGTTGDRAGLDPGDRGGLDPGDEGERAAAFVIAHQARPACFVLVYWWASSVDLCLAYFRSPLERPAELSPMPEHSTGCVWELALTNHERTAWVEHVLNGDPSLDAYLAAGAPAEI